MKLSNNLTWVLVVVFGALAFTVYETDATYDKIGHLRFVRIEILAALTNDSCTSSDPFADPDSCSAYYQCFFVNSIYYIFNFVCGEGGYYDQATASCLEGTCPNPPSTIATSEPPTTVATSEPPTTVATSEPPTTVATSEPPTTVATSDPSTTGGSTVASEATTAGSTEATTVGSTEATTAGSTEATTAGSTEATTAGSTEATTAGSTEATTGGSTEATTAGSTEATTAGSTEATTAGSTEATTAGSTAATTAGSTEATTGGSTEATTGGSTEATTGGSTEATTGGSTEATTGGSTIATTGGSTDSTTGGSTDATTGGSTEVTTGTSTDSTTRGSTDSTTGGSTDSTTGATTEITTTGPSTTPSTRYNCQANGTFIDPEDPSKYFLCIEIEGSFFYYVYTCPANACYDEIKKLCRPNTCPVTTVTTPGTTVSTPTTTGTTPAASTSLAPITLNCTTEGVFPYPGTCNRYYRCIIIAGNMYAYEYTCALGTYFDPTRNLCVVGTCPATTSPPSTTPAISDTTPTTVSQSSTTGTTPPLRYNCNAPGYFADPLDCKGYYECVQASSTLWYAYIYQCPSGTYYSSSPAGCLIGECPATSPTTPAVSDSTTASSQTTPATTTIAVTTGITSSPAPTTSVSLTTTPATSAPTTTATSAPTTTVTSAPTTTATSTPATTPGPIECTEKGWIADPTDCKSYYLCSSGGAYPYHFTCPPGSYFFPTTVPCAVGTC